MYTESQLEEAWGKYYKMNRLGINRSTGWSIHSFPLNYVDTAFFDIKIGNDKKRCMIRPKSLRNVSEDKLNAIKNAWGEVYYNRFGKHIDKDTGILSEKFLTNKDIETLNTDPSIGIVGAREFPYQYRPKSLEGIENNNGWVRIISIDDVPQKNIDCIAKHKNGHKYLCNSRKDSFWCYEPKLLISYYGFTHYKPIDFSDDPII